MAGEAEFEDEERLFTLAGLGYRADDKSDRKRDRAPAGQAKSQGGRTPAARRLRDQQRMTARIYQRPKNAMQSGKALTDQWLLEFEQSEARRPDPLMGWTGSGDTQAQVRLTFPDKDAAKAYADKHGIAARVHATPPKALKLQAYADNFR